MQMKGEDLIALQFADDQVIIKKIMRNSKKRLRRLIMHVTNED